jgi:hypothetical protein
VTGTGTTLLLFGIGMGTVALDSYNETADFVVGTDGSLNDRKSLASDAKLFALLADIGLISGSLLLAGAGLLFFLRQSEIETSESRLPIDIGFDRQNVWARFTGTL